MVEPLDVLVGLVRYRRVLDLYFRRTMSMILLTVRLSSTVSCHPANLIMMTTLSISLMMFLTMIGVSSFLLRVRECLGRHCNGDWGDVGEDSRGMNDDAIEAERKGEPTDRLFSLYGIDGRDIYIITECDRSVTTILFPDEY